jgi:hypothetical protein
MEVSINKSYTTVQRMREIFQPSTKMALRSCAVLFGMNLEWLHGSWQKKQWQNQMALLEFMGVARKFLKDFASPSTRPLYDRRNLLRWLFVLMLSLAGIGHGFWLSHSLDLEFLTGYNDAPTAMRPRSWENNTDIPLHAGLDNSVSACLMFMDDNHRLVEWLAYHYFVMPLRHVVVLPDPDSRTSPMVVLERWKPYMTVEVWNDTYGVNTNDTLTGHDDLVKRQGYFYSECGLYLRSRNRTWTMFIDVDEFWAIDETNVPDWKRRMREQGAILQLIDELRVLRKPKKSRYKTDNITLYQGMIP